MNSESRFRECSDSAEGAYVKGFALARTVSLSLFLPFPKFARLEPMVVTPKISDESPKATAETHTCCILALLLLEVHLAAVIAHQVVSVLFNPAPDVDVEREYAKRE